MSKKAKHTKPTSYEHGAVTVPGKVRDFTLITTVVFFIVALVGILNHEMWRDEYQAWLIARDSHSLYGLYQNCLYEGHPMLWHLLLYFITCISNNIAVMQGFNLMIATAVVYLFNKHAPFGWIQKILFSFGYYTLYEYTVISRYHALGLLLVLIFCVLYKHRQKNIFWLCIVLFLLANTSVFDLILSASLSAFLVLSLLLNGRKNRTEDGRQNMVGFFGLPSSVIRPICFLIVIVGIILSVLQILPEKDNYVQASFSSLNNWHWMKVVVSKLYDAYTLLPELKILPLWDLSGRTVLESKNAGSEFFISILLLIASSLILLRKPLALVFYFIGTIGLWFVYGIVFVLAPRYIGHTFIVFVAAIWLAEYVNEHRYKISSMNTFSGFGKKIQNVFIILIFGSQVISGISIYATDLDKPFSASKETAAFIREQKLDTLPIIGSKDYVMSSFAEILNKPIYFPERGEQGTFIFWDGKRNDKAGFNEVIASMDTVLDQYHRKALVIMNAQPSYMTANGQMMVEHDTVDLPKGFIKLDILSKFERSMVADEVFYIYLAQRIK